MFGFRLPARVYSNPQNIGIQWCLLTPRFKACFDPPARINLTEETPVRRYPPAAPDVVAEAYPETAMPL